MAKTTAEATETEWRALYDAADELRALAPWEWMLDSDLFAVRDPGSGQIGYCCVMGNLGEHYALAVYLGADGLRGYREIASGDYEDRPAEALFTQRCLMVSFEDRELLDKDSYAQIKALGRKYRGRQAWPELRDYTPGYLPWRLEPPQVRFLTVAIQQTCDVARRFKDDEGYLVGPDEGQMLLREYMGGEWKERWHRPEPAAPATAEPPPPVDELRLKRLAGRRLKRLGVWEADRLLFPGAVQGEKGGRPYYPPTLLIVDSASGIVLPPMISEPGAWRQAFQGHLLDLCEQMNGAPREIRLRDEALVALLAPIAGALKVRLRRSADLPALDDARDGLLEAMGVAGPDDMDYP
jgi:hypothetical protein